MLSQTYWLVPDHVIYWKLTGEIPGSEICAISKFIEKQVNRNTVHKVHLIIDCTQLRKLDYTNREARDAFAVLAKKSWMGQAIAIVRNDVIKIQMNALSRAFGMDWKNVTSMQYAIESLKLRDRSLHRIPEKFSDAMLMQPERR